MQLTDTHLITNLETQGIDTRFIELYQDYAPASLGKEHSPYSQFWKDTQSGKRIMINTALPMVNDEGGWIEPRWYQVRGKIQAGTNVFSAGIKDRQVQVNLLDKELIWTPQLFAGTSEIKPAKKPSLLELDPVNKNYGLNTYEWDYPICKRRLRLIHGGVLERWIVSQHPNADIRVKHNKQGNLSLNLAGAWDADGRHLPVIYTEDEEIVPKSSFDGATFPVTIGASLTSYSTSSDGGGRSVESAVYLTARNSAVWGGDAPWVVQEGMPTGQRKIGSDYYVYGMWTYHDTSGLPDVCTISAGDYSLYGIVDLQIEEDGGQTDVRPYEGTQSDPLSDGDPQDFNSTILTDNAANWEYPLATDAYNTVSLNAAGIALINKTGTTLYCFKTSGTMDSSVPNGQNTVDVYTNEKGAGFQPRLVVTYTVPVTFIPRIIGVI